MDALAVVYAIVCLGTMETYVSEHLIKMGVSIGPVGAMLASAPGGYTVCSIVFSRKLKDMSLRGTIVAGMAGSAVAMLLLGPPAFLPAQWWIVVLGITLMGTSAAAAFIPSLPDMIECAQEHGFSSSDPQVANSLSSIASGAFSLGQMLGPVLSGCLLMYMDFEGVTIVLAAVGPVGIAGFLLTRGGKRQVVGGYVRGPAEEGVEKTG